jgi:hypothetical protein
MLFSGAGESTDALSGLPAKKEVNFKAEERQERARQLGIDWKLAEQHVERRPGR